MYKILKPFFNIVITLFGVLFAIFFVYVLKDSKNIKTTSKFVEIGSNQKEIKLDLDNNAIQSETKQKVLDMEPAISEETNSNKIANSNKFYYNQLDKYSKLIYESLENQKDNLKTGTATISLPDEIKDIIEEESLESIFTIAINSFEYDNPDVYYIDISKLVLYYEKYSSNKYNIYLKKDEKYGNYLNDGFNNKQDVEKTQADIDRVVNEIEKGIENQATDYDKILYIHDWIVENVKYDETLNKANRNNIYGAFVEKEVTCGGYAKAFKYLVDKLNIDCIIVLGEATSEQKTEDHAWNYIQLNNKWYGIDCTWDDPIIIGADDETKQKYYTYFLKGQEAFDKHKPFKTFFYTNLNINYPILNNENYN